MKPFKHETETNWGTVTRYGGGYVFLFSSILTTIAVAAVIAGHKDTASCKASPDVGAPTCIAHETGLAEAITIAGEVTGTMAVVGLAAFAASGEIDRRRSAHLARVPIETLDSAGPVEFFRQLAADEAARGRQPPVEPGGSPPLE